MFFNVTEQSIGVDENILFAGGGENIKIVV